jgi:hypothetical protein
MYFSDGLRTDINLALFGLLNINRQQLTVVRLDFEFVDDQQCKISNNKKKCGESKFIKINITRTHLNALLLLPLFRNQKTSAI